MQPLQWWLSPDENAISEASKIQKCNSWFSLDENAIWDISEIIQQFPARDKFTMLRKRNQAISCSPYMERSVYLNRLCKSKNDVFKVLSHFVPFCNSVWLVLPILQRSSWDETKKRLPPIMTQCWPASWNATAPHILTIRQCPCLTRNISWNIHKSKLCWGKYIWAISTSNS